MLASGVLSYTEPVTSARTEFGQEAHPTAIGPLSVWVDKTHPATGKKFEGWHWRNRSWPGATLENDYDEVPRNYDPTDSGIPEDYYLSGIGSGDDLELENIQVIPSSGMSTDQYTSTWLPQVNHGYYYDFNQERYLYSDDSIVQYPTSSGVVQGISQAFGLMALTDIPKTGIPIYARQYEWDAANGKYNVVLDVQKRAEFTGTRDADLVRQSTFDDNRDQIIWENVDTSFDEFVVVDSGVNQEIVFNKLYVSEVPGGDDSLDPNVHGLWHFAAPDPTEDNSGHSYTAIPDGATCHWISDEGGYYTFGSEFGTFWTNSYIVFPTGEDINTTGEFSFYFRAPDITFWDAPDVVYNLCSYFAGPGPNQVAVLGYAHLLPTYNHSLMFVKYDVTGTNPEAYIFWPDVPCRDMDWHKFTISWNISANTINMYVDGVEAPTMISMAPLTPFVADPGNLFAVGSDSQAAAGDYDEVRFGVVNHVTGPVEFLGYADGSTGQLFHTKYAPIDDTQSPEVYSYLMASGLITAWEPVAQGMVASGYQVTFDKDLGIFQFDANLPETGATVVASYNKTLRVEYEPDGSTDNVTGLEANVNSLHRKSSNGFVRLATTAEDPATIVLEAELAEISTDVFGPLYIGNTSVPIIATVYDSNGNVLEDEEVTFVINTHPLIGSLSAGETAIASTDPNGKARTYYATPRGIDELGEDTTATDWSEESSPTDPPYSGVYSRITRLRLDQIPVEGNTDEIFVYQILTDDPTQGYLDPSADLSNTEIQASGYYKAWLDAEGITGATNSPEWEDAHRLVWDLLRPSIYSPYGGRGRRVLVATEDSNYLDPHLFTTSAVGPFQPVNIEIPSDGIYDVVFDTSVYDLPKPTVTDAVPSGTLFGYFVVSPTSVKLQASVYNQRLHRTITSNEISIRLKIPPYLSGVWTIDSINQTHIDEISALLAGMVASGQRVPLGWRLKSSRVTLAAALDGVTFLDINPQYNYDPYDVTSTFPPTVSGVVISGVNLGHQVRVYPIA